MEVSYIHLCTCMKITLRHFLQIKISFPSPGYLQIKQNEGFLKGVLILGCLILSWCQVNNNLLGQSVRVSDTAGWKRDCALRIHMGGLGVICGTCM